MLWKLYHIQEKIQEAKNRIDEKNESLTELKEVQAQHEEALKQARKKVASATKAVQKQVKEVKKREKELEEKVSETQFRSDILKLTYTAIIETGSAEHQRKDQACSKENQTNSGEFNVCGEGQENKGRCAQELGK